jgi:integrase
LDGQGRHTVTELADDNGYLGRNPLDGVKPPRKAAKGSMRSLELEEVRRLAEVIDERFRASVWLGTFCGLRRGEMLALRWENVNMVGRRFEVVAQMDPSGKAGDVKAPKWSAGRRTISMPSVVVEALAEHAARENARDGAIGPRTGLVFTAVKRWAGRPEQLRRACVETGRRGGGPDPVTAP